MESGRNDDMDEAIAKDWLSLRLGEYAPPSSARQTPTASSSGKGPTEPSASENRPSETPDSQDEASEEEREPEGGIRKRQQILNQKKIWLE